MLIVKKPKLIDEGQRIKIIYPIQEDAELKECVFLVDRIYKDALSVDRGDSILVMLLMYAIKNNHDIKMEIPVSSRLYYQLITYHIDAFTNVGKEKGNKVKIDAELTNEKYIKTDKERIVATGMSLGVDSLCTFYTHNKEALLNEYKVNLLTLFNVGAFSYGDGLEMNGEYELHREQVELFAKEVGLPLLAVNSNFASLFSMDHDLTDSLRNCGLVLMFQRLIDVYYYSSTYNLNAFKIGLNKASGYYDIYTLHNISTDNVLFYSANASYTRYRKTQSISEFDLAQRYLSVCTIGLKNCGKCQKCTRTLAMLEANDSVEKFHFVFDLNQYKKRKHMILGYAWAAKKEVYYDVIFSVLKEKKKFTFKSYAYGILFSLAKPVERFMRKLPAEKRRNLVQFANKHNIRVPY